MSRPLGDERREGVGLLVDRTVDVGDLGRDLVGGADRLDRDQLVDAEGSGVDLVEGGAHGDVHALGGRADVGVDLAEDVADRGLHARWRWRGRRC